MHAPTIHSVESRDCLNTRRQDEKKTKLVLFQQTFPAFLLHSLLTDKNIYPLSWAKIPLLFPSFEITLICLHQSNKFYLRIQKGLSTPGQLACRSSMPWQVMGPGCKHKIYLTKAFYHWNKQQRMLIFNLKRQV